ncbi:G-type lectin S-receptor-like serine/threonine-protein kinase SD1-29 [Acorus calamus]|uniref:non-specific serine/threonine protein kinase n=1 Tax=Acorus calamus TaxID=4465 RepID=A0AAV9C962_ACOCL|nr:G-type lectin S-receptor-like serine/threonine-protein kinase SD1-29 [Acorus calamus]
MEGYITFSSNALGRYLLDSTGKLKMMYWEDSITNWTVNLVRPGRPCDIYDRCGPNSICDGSTLAQTCSCLQGFEPQSQKDWEAGNWSGGCVRMKPLSCDNKGDMFFKLQMLKLPDRLRLTKNESRAACEAECVNNCECMAYTFVNATRVGSLSRCMVWGRNLMDLEQLIDGGEYLYVRLVASELEKRSRVLFGELRSSNLLARAKSISSDVPLFNFSDVQAATNNFSTSNKLGEGGFGPVYMGRLSQCEIVAVKRLSKSSKQGLEEFKNEVELIARLQHMNLVRLLGLCDHENENILIYEYLANKSLDKFIFDSTRSGQLDWVKRYHIIEGIAQGLLYLHQYSRLRIIHRDLKTSNILLDDSMNPKISDFGLARIFGGTQNEANTERVVGT